MYKSVRKIKITFSFRAKALVHSFLFGSCAARKKKRMQPRKEKRGLLQFLVSINASKFNS
jgi:hypothetical protein